MKTVDIVNDTCYSISSSLYPIFINTFAKKIY
jgi:hypothetical protein